MFQGRNSQVLAGLKMPVADSGKEQVGSIVGRDDGKVCFTFFMALSWVGNRGSTPWMSGPSVVVDSEDRRPQLELCSHYRLVWFSYPLHEASPLL